MKARRKTSCTRQLHFTSLFLGARRAIFARTISCTLRWKMNWRINSRRWYSQGESGYRMGVLCVMIDGGWWRQEKYLTQTASQSVRLVCVCVIHYVGLSSGSENNVTRTVAELGRVCSSDAIARTPDQWFQVNLNKGSERKEKKAVC